MEVSLEAIKARCIEDGDCWEWGGSYDRFAPIMRGNGSRRLLQVRRVVLTLVRGVIQPKRLAHPSCGNKRCVAPDHMLTLTRGELQRRTAARTQYGQSLARSAKLSISARRRSSLTADDVRKMRESNLSTRAAAAAFGCSQSTAADIMAYRSWKDYSSPFAQLTLP